jgi:hypothetical protein
MRPRIWLRQLVGVAAVLMLLLATAYTYLTRPEALRARFVDLLEKMDLRVVRIGTISFSPIAGLQVLDLEVAAGAGWPWASTVELPDRPPLLQVARTRVSANPWMLVLGRFQPRAVQLDAPTITVVWPGGERSTWTLGVGERLALPREIPTGLPRLWINAADIRVFVVEDGRLQLQRSWVVDAQGAPVDGGGGEPRAYVLRLGRIRSAAGIEPAPGAAPAELHLQAGRLIAESDWIDLDPNQTLVPEGWAELARRLRLSGRVRLKRIVLDSGGTATAEVECDDLRCAIPVEAEISDSAVDCFARLTNTAATISLERNGRSTAGQSGGPRGRLKLQLAGQLNDAAVAIGFSVDDIADRPRTRAGVDAPAATELLDRFEFGAYQAEVRVEGLTLPTLRDNPRFVTSERLPEALRNWMGEYDADGVVNLHVTAEKDGSKGALRYRGELEALDGSCRYADFPYRIADARGYVRFSNDGITFDGVHGRHGGSRIRLDGRLADSTSETGFELSFRGHNVVSDADLYAALPARYQALWRRASPVGLWDVQVGLQREQGSAETGSLPTEVRVDARLLTGSLELHDGRRLENADGLVHVVGGRIELDDLHGYMDGALTRVNGYLQSTDGDSPQYNVHVEVADAAVRQTSELRDEAGHLIGQFDFAGTGNVWAQLGSADAGPGHYAIQITDGVLTGFDAGEPWRQAEGWISVRADEQRICALTARRDSGDLVVTGTLPAQLGLQTPITLDLRASDEDLGRLLQGLVPGRWSKVYEALGLSGCGKLTAQFRPRAVAGASDQQAAEIQLEAEHMRPTPMPLDLHDIEAELSLHADGFELYQAGARYGQAGRLALSGHGGWSEGNVWTDIDVDARDVEIDPQLVQAMPKPLAALLKRMVPRGRIQLKLDQVLRTEAQQSAWDIVGQILLDDAELNVGLPLTAFAGRLKGRCGIGPDGGVKLDAGFSIDRGRLAGRPIERWEGRIVCQPDCKTVRLEEVRGRLGGGEVAGFAEIDLDTLRYELSFTLHDVSLDQFLRDKPNETAQTIRGQLDGHIFVRGSLDDPTERDGGGELRIRGTSLLSSSVTASVVDASRRENRSISQEVERAELRFVWEGAELKLTEVDIHSRDLRLIGAGRWNMRSDAISLTLLGATPEDFPRLFLLTDLLESAGQELLQYCVEGTVAEPRVTIEPLHNLTEPLRRLLKGD